MAEPPRLPLMKPKTLQCIKDPSSLTLQQLALQPRSSWDKAMLSYWDIGEQGAKKALNQFLKRCF